jgi:hypothetical protein
MDTSLETLVVAASVFACSLSIPRPGPVGDVTDQELIALAVAQAIAGLVSDRQFPGMIGRLLAGFSRRLPDRSQFNRRLRRLRPAAAPPPFADRIAFAAIRVVGARR